MTHPTTEPTHSIRERLDDILFDQMNRYRHASTSFEERKLVADARNAILAELQEPSEGMRRIAATYLGFLPDESKGQGEAVRISMWRAMIQHIRNGAQ